MKLKRVGNKLCRGSTVLQTVDCSCGGGGPTIDNCCSAQANIGTVSSGPDQSFMLISGVASYFRQSSIPNQSYSVTRNLNTEVPIASCSASILDAITDDPGYGNRGLGASVQLNAFSSQFPNSRPRWRVDIDNVASSGVPSIGVSSLEVEWFPFAATPFVVDAVPAFPTSWTVLNNSVSVTPIFSGPTPRGFRVAYNLLGQNNNDGTQHGISGDVTLTAENIGPCTPSGILVPSPPGDPRATLTPENAFKGGCCGQ